MKKKQKKNVKRAFSYDLKKSIDFFIKRPLVNQHTLLCYVKFGRDISSPSKYLQGQEILDWIFAIKTQN